MKLVAFPSSAGEISTLSWTQLQILGASLIDELPAGERVIGSTPAAEIATANGSQDAISRTQR